MLDNNHKKYSSKGLGDILDFVKSDRFSLSEFRRKQSKLIEAGATNQHSYGVLICDGDDIESCTCSECKSRLVGFNYRLGASPGVIEFEFQGCLNCWQFWELFPVYENFHPDRDSLNKKLVLLDDNHLRLVGLIVKTLMD
jgi:hypothetical protein